MNHLCFISELNEENKEKEDLSEVEEKNHVKTGEKTLSCFQTKQKDLKKRRTKKYFTCTQCGKSLTCKHSLELHMRVHTGEKLYSCVQCRKTFLRASVLKQHLRVHIKEKPHSCHLCGKSFHV